MPIIKNYIQQDDGTITAVIEGVTLENKDFLLLDNGLEVECEVSITDPYKITDKQRRKIFALMNDIEAHTGQPQDYMRNVFQEYVRVLYAYENRISLADCSRKVAGQIIDIAIEWIFENDIPLRFKTSDLIKNDRTFLYMATINRKCVICGKHAELAHYQAVGRGRNRRNIEHFGNKVLALCHSHHQEQHTIGMDSFNSKYHLTDSWVDVDDKLNRMLKGLKIK
ncbi:putative HNHc nuclease [Staphylococcus saprophyticus]|uniref:putative HNHc nuclease n=1 Tax=Staphylococcus saprophyticus TaxID=29385 RepID=UPI002DB92157|nr:putative HNHc nuclease [Staphylococcus saprophyticus]MEB5646761.1 putative HNHc nuclease [Staphylococcus saprophyticus]